MDRKELSLTCVSAGLLKSLSTPLLSFLCILPLSTTSHTSTFTVSLVTVVGEGERGGRGGHKVVNTISNAISCELYHVVMNTGCWEG